MKYAPKLDGLRFVAIALVLIEHFGIGIGRFISAGYYGVNLFFVISGFLITTILLNTNGSFINSFKNFIARRSLRVFPIYYLTVFILLFLQVNVVKEYLFYFLTYTYNYALYTYDVPLNSVVHFWSLCFEEQFYLVWPFFILLLKRCSKTLVLISICIVIFCFSLLTFKHINGTINYKIIAIFSSIGFLTTGGVAAILFKLGRVSTFILSNKYVEYISLTILLFSLTINHPFKYVVLAYCSVYLVLKSVHTNFSIAIINKFLSNKKVIYIGTISYGIYVYHYPLCMYIDAHIFNPLWFKINFDSLGFLQKIRFHSWLIKLPLYSLISILGASVSYRYIEQPILRFKDKHFKKANIYN